jgi:hypothetical protein
MLQMVLYLIWTNRLRIFQPLEFEVFKVRLQKNATSNVSLEILKGAIFDRMKIKYFFHDRE